MTQILSRGFSQAAEMLDRVKRDVSRGRIQTVTFSNHPLDDQLVDVFSCCAGDGWEGEGSVAVASETLMIAKGLIESLPRAYRTPVITGEPDGHVSLEWYVNPRWILTVSVAPNRVLHWAALSGEEDPRGACRFFGEAPKTLLYWIGRVCNG